jgi:hypothetical protein
MFKNVLLGLAALSLIGSLSLGASKSVSFISPKDGAEVPTTFKANFGEKGMKITPAGQDIDDKTKGHFHLIIDGPAAAEGKVIPADATHLHFGKGQTESGDITLTPGKHTLTLQFADGLHRAYGTDLTKTITVTVK